MKKPHWSASSHKILEKAETMHRYNRWIISHFTAHFGKKILEIGSGQGGLSRLLPQKAIVVLSDIFDEYIATLKRKFTDPVIHLDIENECPEKLRDKFESVFSSNVFEHIEDDQLALRNAYKLLEDGGRLLLFVPARPEIFGKLDEEMGHYRRYTKKELLYKAQKAGFKVVSIYYANFPGYFTWWGRGVVLSLFIKSSKANRTDSKLATLFDTIITPFLYLEKFIHPPFGQSLVLIAQKSSK